MPTGFYGIITDRDMNAIVAYLRTLKPIKNKVPDPVYSIPGAAPDLPRLGEALHRGDAQEQA